MSWGRPLQHWHRWIALCVGALGLAIAVAPLSWPATVTAKGASAATASATASTAPNSLNPVIIGSNDSAPAQSDPLVKVATGDSGSGSADGGGNPKGYTGLVKLTGLVIFLAFAWGWWAWGGQMGPATVTAGPAPRS